MICVPARDEEQALAGLLHALAALDRDGSPPTLCLYLDGCGDDSGAVVRRAAAAMPVPAAVTLAVAIGPRNGVANAGLARTAAMAMGMDRLASADGLLFTTDADSRPRPDWIRAGRAALARADVAAGRIVRRADPAQSRAGAEGAQSRAGAEGAQWRMERYLDRLHAYRRLIDPVPWEARDTHHFGGGANLAIRSSAYRAIGGFRPLPSAEDATLLDDAARAGFRVRRDAAMLVDTSSRRHGRAPQGLASVLRALDEGRSPCVAHPGAAAWQWREQAVMRFGFDRIDDIATRVRLGRRLGLSGDHVLGVARDCPNAEAFAMRIVPAAPGGAPMVGLDEAEDALAALEAAWCEAAA